MEYIVDRLHSAFDLDCSVLINNLYNKQTCNSVQNHEIHPTALAECLVGNYVKLPKLP